MVFNTTSASSLDKWRSPTYQALIKQLVFGIVGVGIAFFFYRSGYQNVVNKSPYLLMISTFLLILVFIPKIGLQLHGAKRWIRLLGFSFQPSEIAKFVLPIYFIHRIVTLTKEMDVKTYLKILSYLALPLALILLEPDNGTTLIIAMTLVVLFILCRVRWIYWALPLFFLVLLGGLVAYQMPHVHDRIRIYLNPELDLQGKGHQPYQAKIAAGSGRLWGKGLGESLQKLNYLPEARSDYIAAIYAEEFGFIGVSFLLLLYMLFAYAGFQIAMQAKDPIEFYLASLITFMVSFQAFLNLGVVSTLLPSKGTTLPFFSMGGTSLTCNLIAVFLLIRIEASCQKKLS